MTLKDYYKKYDPEILRLIKNALREDKVNNDVTTNLLLKGKHAREIRTATLLCKQNCILAGLEVFKKVFLAVDPSVKFKQNKKIKDGTALGNKQKVVEVKASLKTLLIAERTALNFIQRMSGIATLTNSFANKLKYPGSKILHTRKTTPNFRIFEIAAVKTGGGDFLRQDLSSAIMVKDNHIESTGSLVNAVKELRKTKINESLKSRLEIEVKNIDEVLDVINYGKGLVKIVMLDNFKPEDINDAIKLLKDNKFKIEVSGGVNAENFASYQRKGIDYYSIGMLTHSYKSADFSLEF